MDNDTEEHRTESYKAQADKWRKRCEVLEGQVAVLREGLEQIPILLKLQDKPLERFIRDVLAKARTNESEEA